MENQSKPNDLLVSLCWYTERYKEVLFFSVVILFLDSLFGVAVFRRVQPHHHQGHDALRHRRGGGERRRLPAVRAGVRAALIPQGGTPAVRRRI